jgi:hypothetical protein
MSEQPFSASPTGWQHGNTLRRPPCCFPTPERLMRAKHRARKLGTRLAGVRYGALTPRVVEFTVSPAMKLQLAELTEVVPIPQARAISVEMNTSLPAGSFSASVTNVDDADHFSPARVEVKTEVREGSPPRFAWLITSTCLPWLWQCGVDGPRLM